MTAHQIKSASATSTSSINKLTVLALSASLALCIAIIAAPSRAATANWDQADVTHIQGYRLYAAEGACSNPSYFVFVQAYGAVFSGPVPTPVEGGTFCYFLTAYNSIGESLPSNRAEFAFPVPPPQCPSVAYCKTLRGKARKECLACK